MPDLTNIWELWRQGGWVMLPLFALAVYICAISADLLLFFWRNGGRTVPASVWAGWVARPARGSGEVGEIIRYTQDQAHSLAEIQQRFAEVLAAKLPRIDRRLMFLHTLVMAAPLLGLLGTVLGMLNTFRGLASESGGLLDLVASGISEALITTEIGLLIAVPGYLALHLVRRKREEYEAFLGQLESVTMQHFQTTR
jgi:biopolymer transport protein ExbB